MTVIQMNNELGDSQSIVDSLRKIARDASMADKIITEVLRDIAVRRFRNWCEREQILKWVIGDPSNYFFVMAFDVLNPEQAQLLAVKHVRDNLTNFEDRIKRMNVKEIFDLFSYLTNDNIKTFMITYSLPV